MEKEDVSQPERPRNVEDAAFPESYGYKINIYAAGMRFVSTPVTLR